MKKKWIEVCEAYLKAFCEKHGYVFEDCYWPGDDVGSVAILSDDFTSVNMDDIRYDIDNDVPENVFDEWWQHSYDTHAVEISTGMKLRHINYSSWCKGAPKPYTDGEMHVLRKVGEIMDKYNLNL